MQERFLVSGKIGGHHTYLMQSRGDLTPLIDTISLSLCLVDEL